MRLVTVVAFGAGYVLGTKAGRERFDQLASWAQSGIPALTGPDLQERLERYAANLEQYANRAQDSPLADLVDVTRRREAR